MLARGVTPRQAESQAGRARRKAGRARRAAAAACACTARVRMRAAYAATPSGALADADALCLTRRGFYRRCAHVRCGLAAGLAQAAVAVPLPSGNAACAAIRQGRALPFPGGKPVRLSMRQFLQGAQPDLAGRRLRDAAPHPGVQPSARTGAHLLFTASSLARTVDWHGKISRVWAAWSACTVRCSRVLCVVRQSRCAEVLLTASAAQLRGLQLQVGIQQAAAPPC